MPSLPPLPKNQGQILKAIVLVPTAVAVLAAIWVSTSSIIENIRFARATDQILHTVSVLREVAATDKNFATHPGEDLLVGLGQAGLLAGVMGGTPATLENSWKGTVISNVVTASTARIEAVMPTRDCRRMSLFFVRNSADLGLNLMEARENSGGIWHRFYDRAVDASIPGNAPVEAACGQDSRATLALIFQLR